MPAGPGGAGVLDQAGVEVALLDGAGVIVAVNQSWRAFWRDNGGSAGRGGPGESYLEVCVRAAHDPTTRQVEASVREAVVGRAPTPRTVVIGCHSPQQSRWFELSVASRYDDGGGCLGATVTLAPLLLAGPAPVASERPEPVPGGSSRPGRVRRGAPDLDGAAVAALITATPDGQVLVDAAGTIAFVNPRLEALSGYSRAELLGRPIELLVPVQVRDTHRELRQAYLEGPIARMAGRTTALALHRRDGSTVAVEVSLAPVKIAETMMVVASVRDVTEQRAADRERQRLLSLLDLVPDAVYVHDSALRLEYVNDAAARWLGLQRHELVGMSIADLDAGIGPGSVAAMVSALAERGPGPAVAGTFVLRHRDGTELPAEAHVQVIDGDEAGFRFVVVARDVRRRLVRQAQLRASEEFFRAAFERAPIGMAVVGIDEEGRREIVRPNQALADMVGADVDMLVGRDFAEFTDPEDEPSDRAVVGQMARDRGGDYARRRRYRRVDGSTGWVEVRSSVVDLPDLAGVTALAHFVDVTSQEEVERRRARRAVLAQRLADVTSVLLAGTAPAGIFTALVEAAQEVAEADDAALVLADRATGEPVRVAQVGAAASQQEQQQGIPFSAELLRTVHELGAAVGFAEPAPGSDPRPARILGPVAGAPVLVGSGRRGLLSVARLRGAAPFSDTDLELLTRLATQISLTIEIADARADQHRLALLEDRQRIARDLHDTVIQDLIALGMQVDVRTGREPDESRRARDAEVIDQLDTAVRRLRRVVFAVREPSRSSTLERAVRATAEEAARVLGYAPVVTIRGQIDQLPARIQDHLTSVLRESLSNVARHARATMTDVSLIATDERVALTVEDDGRGIGDGARYGTGLANLRERALELGGTVTVGPRAGGGTRLEWTCRIERS